MQVLCPTPASCRYCMIKYIDARPNRRVVQVNGMFSMQTPNLSWGSIIGVMYTQWQIRCGVYLTVLARLQPRVPLSMNIIPLQQPETSRT